MRGKEEEEGTGSKYFPYIGTSHCNLTPFSVRRTLGCVERGSTLAFKSALPLLSFRRSVQSLFRNPSVWAQDYIDDCKHAPTLPQLVFI